MSNGVKTALIVGGTVVATTVAIDLLTGGAVRAAIGEKIPALAPGNGAAPAAPAAEPAA